MGRAIKKIKTASSCVVGRSHKENNIECQDRVSSYEGKNIGIISLSDGAGSCKYSAIGAEISTNSIVNNLKENFDFLFKLTDIEKINKFILSKILFEIGKIAKDKEARIKDFSATLLFVAIKNNKYIAGHIGDGVIGFLTTDDQIFVLSEPNNAEYINTTYFITDSNAYENMKIYKGRTNGITGFIIMSDGAAFSMYDKRNKVLAEASKKMINWLENYNQDKVCSALTDTIENMIKKRTTDDCSIGIIKICNHFISKDILSEFIISKFKSKFDCEIFINNHGKNPYRKLERFSKLSGVYLFADKNGEVLFVGVSNNPSQGIKEKIIQNFTENDKEGFFRDAYMKNKNIDFRSYIQDLKTMRLYILTTPKGEAEYFRDICIDLFKPKYCYPPSTVTDKRNGIV